jgi:hypothetical protein
MYQDLAAYREGIALARSDGAAGRRPQKPADTWLIDRLVETVYGRLERLGRAEGIKPQVSIDETAHPTVSLPAPRGGFGIAIADLGATDANLPVIGATLVHRHVSARTWPLPAARRVDSLNGEDVRFYLARPASCERTLDRVVSRIGALRAGAACTCGSCIRFRPASVAAELGGARWPLVGA